jgi:hypothetical protein
MRGWGWLKSAGVQVDIDMLLYTRLDGDAFINSRWTLSQLGTTETVKNANRHLWYIRNESLPEYGVRCFAVTVDGSGWPELDMILRV